jgi:hypothetical protein
MSFAALIREVQYPGTGALDNEHDGVDDDDDYAEENASNAPTTPPAGEGAPRRILRSRSSQKPACGTSRPSRAHARDGTTPRLDWVSPVCVRCELAGGKGPPAEAREALPSLAGALCRSSHSCCC